MEETSHIRGPRSSAGLLECPQQHDVDMPSGGTMVLEATMTCTGNSECPPHCFSSGKPRPWIRILQQCSSKHRCTPAEETSYIQGPKSSTGVTLTLTPSIILSAKEKETSLLFTNKDYKGLLARSHRKVQMRCHLRGNFPCLGEERAPMKSTKSLADNATRLLGIARSSPQIAQVR